MASFTSKRAHRDAKKTKSFVSAPSAETHNPNESQANKIPSKTVGVDPKLYRGFPSGLEIRRDDVKGRGIWSTDAFKRGSTVLTHRPHVSVLSAPHLATHCSFCISAPKNEASLKRCPKCRTLWYCSPACQNADWQLHKHECAAICKWMTAAPDGSPPGEAVRSLGRILWGRKVEGEGSSWWKEIQALQSHRASLPPSAAESHTQLAHTLVRYLDVTSPTELAPYGLHSAGDLVDLISRFTTNTFTLTSPALTPLGTCVSPLAALFNHSCLPNAVIVFPRFSAAGQSAPPEPLLHVVAIKDLSRGEEAPYIDTTLPTYLRQQALKETYNFTCTCALCCGVESDAREMLWCPRAPACQGTCSAPLPTKQDTEDTQPLPPASRCRTCQAPYPASALPDIEDLRRIGQDALDKASSLQLSDTARALSLTSHMIPLLERSLPPSSHPLLALLRLHQSLLISSLVPPSSSPTASTTSASSSALILPPPPATPDPDTGALLNTAIRASARAVSGLTSVLDDGHPVRALALAELGKLLAVDEPISAGSPSRADTFPPTGAARLALAIDTLKRALRELMIGFGESTRGGEVGQQLREEIVKLEREMGVWTRGVRNAPEDTLPMSTQK